MTVSDEEEVWARSGMLVADKARWIEVGEGVLALAAARIEVRLGLTSLLLLRERKPGREVGLGGAAGRWGRRAGEASREDSGDVAAAGEAGAFRGRMPARAWYRSGAGMGLSADGGPLWSGRPGVAWDAEAGEDGGGNVAVGAGIAADAGAGCGVDVDVDVGAAAGSAASTTAMAVMLGDVGGWAGGLGACCA